MIHALGRKARISLASSVVAAGATLLLLPAGAQAASFSYPGFAGAGDTLQLNGDAGYASGGKVLRLTPDLNSQAGSAFTTKRRVNAAKSFTSRFRIRMRSSDGGIGDGIAFVLQPGPASALGLDGHRLGYGGGTMPAKSIAVGFDRHNSYVKLFTGADGDDELKKRSYHYGDGLGWAGTAWVHYNAPKRRLWVFLSEGKVKPDKPVLSHEINLDNVLGGPARAGFSGSTGGARQINDVINWTVKN